MAVGELANSLYWPAFSTSKLLFVCFVLFYFSQKTTKGPFTRAKKMERLG